MWLTPKKHHPTVPEVLAHGASLPVAGTVSAGLAKGDGNQWAHCCPARRLTPACNPFTKIGNLIPKDSVHFMHV